MYIYTMCYYRTLMEYVSPYSIYNTYCTHIGSKTGSKACSKAYADGVCVTLQYLQYILYTCTVCTHTHMVTVYIGSKTGSKACSKAYADRVCVTLQYLQYILYVQYVHTHTWLLYTYR